MQVLLYLEAKPIRFNAVKGKESVAGLVVEVPQVPGMSVKVKRNQCLRGLPTLPAALNGS